MNKGEFFAISNNYYTLNFLHGQLHPTGSIPDFQGFCDKIKTNHSFLGILGPAGAVPGGDCLLDTRDKAGLINFILINN